MGWDALYDNTGNAPLRDPGPGHTVERPLSGQPVRDANVSNWPISAGAASKCHGSESRNLSVTLCDLLHCFLQHLIRDASAL